MEKTNTNNQLKKIFIGCLPGIANEQNLIEYFSKFGEVINVDVKYNKHTKKICSGFAAITVYENTEKLILAKKDHIFFNRYIDCKKYIKGKKLEKKKKEFEKRRIFVRNIPRKFTDGQLKEFFTKFGAVERAFVIRNSKKIGKKQNLYGFVIFQDEKSAKEALQYEIIEDDKLGMKLNLSKFEKNGKKKKSKKSKKKNENSQVYEKNCDLFTYLQLNKDYNLYNGLSKNDNNYYNYNFKNRAINDKYDKYNLIKPNNARDNYYDKYNLIKPNDAIDNYYDNKINQSWSFFKSELKNSRYPEYLKNEDNSFLKNFYLYNIIDNRVDNRELLNIDNEKYNNSDKNLKFNYVDQKIKLCILKRRTDKLANNLSTFLNDYRN